MTKKEIAEKILEYIAWRDHYAVAPGEEAYHFNIKIYRIEVPDIVRKLMPEVTSDEWYNEHARDALRRFVDKLKRKFWWIEDWGTGGRMGGWLVLVTHDPVLNVFDELGVSWKEGMKRLRGLQEIDRMVLRAKEEFVQELESLDFYRDMIPGLSKRWDPGTE